MTNMQLRGLKAAVLGMARSGVAAARLLLCHGAQVTLMDAKPLADMSQEARAQMAELPCGGRFGADIALPEELDLLVVSPGVPVNAPLLVQARERGVEVIGELELGYRLCPTPNIAAITGTNGKTTTTALLGCIFGKTGRPFAVAGNIGTPLCELVDGLAPDALVALEVSSFQLETVCDFHPRAAALLNLTPDHLNRHGDMEGYLAAKARIFENQQPGDSAIYRAEDHRVGDAVRAYAGDVVAFSRLQGLREGVFVQGDDIVWARGGEGGVIAPLASLRIRGGHNVENALAAAALALGVGVSVEDIAAGFADFPGAAHRMEMVGCFGGMEWVNDSKGTNPDATIKALEAADRPTVLIAGGDDKGTPFDEMAQLIASLDLHHVVLMGMTARKILDALTRCSYAKTTLAGSLEEAVDLAAGLCPIGGQVLLSPACASFDMFRNYEHRGEEFARLARKREGTDG